MLKRVMSPTAPEAIAKSFESRLALADLTGLAERNPAAVLSALDAGKLASFGLDKADMAKVRDVALTARDAAAQGTPATTDPRAPATRIADAGGVGDSKRAAVLVGEGNAAGAVDGSAAPGVMERVLNRMGKTAAKEFQGQIGISKETFQTLRDAKFFRQGGFGPLETVRAFNEVLVGGSAAAVDLAVRASFAIQNALAAGAGQVARELGNSDAMASRLERDLRLLNQIVSVVAVEGAPGAAMARAGRRPVSPPRRSQIADAAARTVAKIPGDPKSVLGGRLRGHLELISDTKTSDAAIRLVSGGRIRKQGRRATDGSNIIIEKHGDLDTATRAFDDAVRHAGGDPSKVPWIKEEGQSPRLRFVATDGTEFKLRVNSSSVSGQLPTVDIQMRARLKKDKRLIKIRYSLEIPVADE